MSDRSELIEQIFQRVEEESARRAREEEEADDGVTQEEREEAQDSVPSPVSAATVASAKQRRRGSVSVSRFGQHTEITLEAVSPANGSKVPSNRPSRSSSFVQKPTLYNVGGYIPNGSEDSLASNSSTEDPSKNVEDEHHSTQMATIAGKQSISRAISRRLSRARSRDVLVSRGNSVMIDVSVEEATVEHHHSVDDEPHDPESAVPRPQSRTAAVFVGNGTSGNGSGNGVLRREKSSPGLSSGNGNGNGEKQGWMSRAKDLTAKFKRKSMAALSQSVR